MSLLSRPARPVPAFMQRTRWLYNASLQRFWLDKLADSLLVRSTQALASELKNFDEKIVNSLAGLPAQTSAVSSLAQWERRKESYFNIAQQYIGHGNGILGKLMERIASLLHWIEERLVLRTGNDGLIKQLQRIGAYLQQTEQLLDKPRYLWLLILATFVVIL